MEKKSISQIGFHKKFRGFSTIKSEIFLCENLKDEKLFAVKAFNKSEVFETAA
jgi:hypothetical protein